MEKNVTQPYEREALAPALNQKNKIPDLSATVRQRVWFPVSTATRSTDLWGFDAAADSHYLCPYDSVIAVERFQHDRQHTTVSPWPPAKGAVDLEMLWDQCFALNSNEKYWVYYSDAGSWSVSLVLHGTTHKDTTTEIQFTCAFQVT